MADGSTKSHGCKKRSTEKRQIQLYTGPMAKKKKYTELLNWYAVELKCGSSTSTTSPRSPKVMMHLIDNDYDFKAPST